MERYFILDKFNTWYDWRLIVTAKNISDPEPKTNLVKLDGRSGSLDLSEALTGEITYDDRTITATFWTDYGTHKDREALLRKITASLHGKKVKIIEPDDPGHYLIGRVKITSKTNILPYAEFTIEATCEPWRYAVEDTVRKIPIPSSKTVDSENQIIDVVLNNNGVKTLCPIITVENATVSLTYNGNTTELSDGSYKISDLKLYSGVNVINVEVLSAIYKAFVTFTYQEADL